MLRRLNEGLPGLIIGILVYGLALQIAGIWIADDLLYYSVGLWYGIAIAVGIAYNLAAVIYDSVMLGDEDAANRHFRIKGILRYVVIVALFLAIGWFRFGSLVMAIFGALGLKAGAYLHPVLGAVSRKLFGDNPIFPADHPEDWPDPDAENPGNDGK